MPTGHYSRHGEWTSLPQVEQPQVHILPCPIYNTLQGWCLTLQLQLMKNIKIIVV